MKKILIILITISLSACSDFLEEDPKGSSLSEEAFFSSDNDLKMAVVPMYYALIRDICFKDDALCFCFGADDVTTHPASNKIYLREFDIFSVTDANTSIETMWSSCYRGLVSANFVIENLERAVATDQVKNECGGQAYFFRAFFNFFLVRAYGSVPLCTSSEVDPEIEKSEPAKIYDLIVSDLKMAEEMLPDTWTSSPERSNGVNVAPTAGSAKALLASVYLQMTGWPIKDESKFALAAAKAKEVIDNENVYEYELCDMDVLWKYSNKYNHETILGGYHNASAKSYHMRSPMAPMPDESNGWCNYFAEINFFNSFPEGPRKEETFLTEIMLKDGDNVITVPWDDERTNQRHPYYKKMIDDRNGLALTNPWGGLDWQDDRTVMIMRYAEVLLVYAEAQAMANGPDASAYEAINRVRSRAGLDDLPANLSKNDFREAVISERAWEFAGLEYCSRWFDLQRLERVEEANANRNEAEIPLVGTPGKDWYYAPIPAEDKLKNPNL